MIWLALQNPGRPAELLSVVQADHDALEKHRKEGSYSVHVQSDNRLPLTDRSLLRHFSKRSLYIQDSGRLSIKSPEMKVKKSNDARGRRGCSGCSNAQRIGNLLQTCLQTPGRRTDRGTGVRTDRLVVVNR